MGSSCQTLDPRDVENYKLATHALNIEKSSVFLNCADDTYILARHSRMLEYQLSTLRATMSMFGQCFHVDKREALTNEIGAEPGPRPRTWTPSEMKLYLATGHYTTTLPEGAEVQYLKTVSQMTVLGSEISLDWHQKAALPARLSCAWQVVTTTSSTLEQADVCGQPHLPSGLMHLAQRPVGPRNRPPHDERSQKAGRPAESDDPPYILYLNERVSPFLTSYDDASDVALQLCTDMEEIDGVVCGGTDP